MARPHVALRRAGRAVWLTPAPTRPRSRRHRQSRRRRQAQASVPPAAPSPAVASPAATPPAQEAYTYRAEGRRDPFLNLIGWAPTAK